MECVWSKACTVSGKCTGACAKAQGAHPRLSHVVFPVGMQPAVDPLKAYADNMTRTRCQGPCFCTGACHKRGPLPSAPAVTMPDVGKIAQSLKPIQTITNPNKEPLTVQLPGGCSVILQPGQSVEVKG